MKYFNKICIITLISNNIIAEKPNFNYITEKDINESTKDKFYLYPLEINEKSYIKTPDDDKKKMIMTGTNHVYFAFKYKNKTYITLTNGCPCCFNNCYSFLNKNDFVDSKKYDLKENLEKQQIESIRFNGKNLFICNEYLKYRNNPDDYGKKNSENNKHCCECNSVKNNDSNDDITSFFYQKVNLKDLLKMIFITDNDFENTAITLDLCENVKIIDKCNELNIISKKTDNEMKTIFENKDYIK